MYTLLSNKALKQIGGSQESSSAGVESRSNKWEVKQGRSCVTPDRVTQVDCLFNGHGFFHLIV